MPNPTLTAPKNVRPARWIVLNIPCTRILSSHDDEASAHAAVVPGSFPYELSTAELYAWQAEEAERAPYVATGFECGAL